MAQTALNHNISLQQYADNTFLYLELSTSNFRQIRTFYVPQLIQTTPAENTADQWNVTILVMCTQVFCAKYSSALFGAGNLNQKQLAQKSMTHAQETSETSFWYQILQRVSITSIIL